MLQDLLATAVKEYPQKTAIVHKDLRLSYSDLYKQVSALGRGLSSLGVKQSDCVALLLPNCPEFVISFHAVINLNAVILPLNHLFKEEEINYYITDSHAKVVITDAQRAEMCRRFIAKTDKAIKLIVIDAKHPSWTHLQDLMLPAENGGDEATSPNDVTHAAGDAIYQYSSGSTGRPKRVNRSQSNLYHEVTSFAATVNLTPDDNILCLVPLYHAHGLGNCLLAATCNGATLVLLEQPLDKEGAPIEVPFVFRCPRVLELIQQEKATILPGVPYIFKALAQTPTKSPVDLSTLRLCFSAGNFLPKDVFDKFWQRFSIPVRQLYGCTEAGSVAINVNGEPQETWNSVGRPVNNVEIRIVNDEGLDLPDGEIGEVVIKSQALTSGYHEMPELNQQAFKNGTFLTGDLGKLDEDKQLYITGRKKILIDTGGRKVDPIEIEDLLITHPEVKEAVVVGVKDPDAGEVVKAVIVPKVLGNSEERSISTYCKARLAEFKVPKIIEFRDEIPKSPLGKVLRKELV
ncbi:MAG: class I adenylate-forming enzyme family protein [Cyanobacteria bacterium P01_F01_bin.86]